MRYVWTVSLCKGICFLDIGSGVASGNSLCNPNCAHLPTAPVNTRMHITSNKSHSILIYKCGRISISEHTVSMPWSCTVPRVAGRKGWDASLSKLACARQSCRGLLSLCEPPIDSTWEALVRCPLPGEGRVLGSSDNADAPKMLHLPDGRHFP